MKTKMANGRALGIAKLEKWLIRSPFLTKIAKSVGNLSAK